MLSILLSLLGIACRVFVPEELLDDVLDVVLQPSYWFDNLKSDERVKHYKTGTLDVFAKNAKKGDLGWINQGNTESLSVFRRSSSSGPLHDDDEYETASDELEGSDSDNATRKTTGGKQPRHSSGTICHVCNINSGKGIFTSALFIFVSLLLTPVQL